MIFNWLVRCKLCLVHIEASTPARGWEPVISHLPKDLDKQFPSLRPCQTRHVFLQLATQGWRMKKNCKLRCTCDRMLNASTCLATMRKVRGYLFFSCNLQRSTLLHCKLRKWGVTQATLFATRNASCVTLQAVEKISSCNMVFKMCRNMFDCLVHEMLQLRALSPSLYVNISESIRAKLVEWHCIINYPICLFQFLSYSLFLSFWTWKWCHNDSETHNITTLLDTACCTRLAALLQYVATCKIKRAVFEKEKLN